MSGAPEVVDVVLADGEARVHHERVVRALTRGLLAVEWEGVLPGTTVPRGAPVAAADRCCPLCVGHLDIPAGVATHERGCCLDEALALAGLPDQASRDAERAGFRNPGSKP